MHLIKLIKYIILNSSYYGTITYTGIDFLYASVFVVSIKLIHLAYSRSAQVGLLGFYSGYLVLGFSQY